MTINMRPSSNSIWVSKNGSDSNSGTATSPFRSIQKAINTVDPGTTIYVKEGTYNENVVISARVNTDLNDTTATKSIALVSADGAGKAHIAGLSNTKSTVEILGMKHLVIDGFRISANTFATKDQAPVKITGAAEAINNTGNIHIINNILSGSGVDAIKAIKTNWLDISNNTFNGNFKEQVVDLVSVFDSVLSNNRVTGVSDSGFGVKGGSTDIDITNNHFTFRSADGKGPAIKVGGEGFNRTTADIPVQLRGFEAKNVTVTNNVVEDSGAYAVVLQGAHNSTVRNNFFDNAGPYAMRAAYSESLYGESENKGNVISGNILVPGKKLILVQSGAELGSTIGSNSTGSLSNVKFSYGPDGSTTAPAPITAPPAPENNVLEIRAGGTGTDAAAPRFTVEVDGIVVGTRTVTDPVSRFQVNNDSHYDSFRFDLGTSKPSTVEITYINDGRSGSINRDLFVDYIVVRGNVYESEIHGDFSAANGNRAFDGPREALYVNGTLTFDLL